MRHSTTQTETLTNYGNVRQCHHTVPITDVIVFNLAITGFPTKTRTTDRENDEVKLWSHPNYIEDLKN